MIRQPIYLQCSERVRNALSSDDFRCRIRNATDGSVDLLIYDGIGDFDGTATAKSVAEFLASNRGRAVNVRINSPGGLAFDGLTIHNALVAHDAPVTTTIEGMAASAAAIIAMAGSRVRQYDNATLFIHRAMGISIGNVDAMNETAEMLAKLDEQIAQTYANKSGKPRASMLQLMVGKAGSDGTQFSAAEAKAAGLIDEIIPTDRGRRVANADPRSPDDRQRCARAARQRVAQLRADEISRDLVGV